MKLISYISVITVPIIIGLAILYGLKEKKNVYELFLSGAKEGMATVVQLFPTILAIFLAIGMMRNSGILNWIIDKISSINRWNIIPVEILPLALLKPISGSASMAIGTEIMKKYGVDSLIGKTAATIMGSTETTLYVVAVYTSCVNIKKTRNVVIIALLADFVGIITSIVVCKCIFI